MQPCLLGCCKDAALMLAASNARWNGLCTCDTSWRHARHVATSRSTRVHVAVAARGSFTDGGNSCCCRAVQTRRSTKVQQTCLRAYEAQQAANSARRPQMQSLSGARAAAGGTLSPPPPPRLLKVAPDRSVIAVYKPAGVPFHTLHPEQLGLLAALRADPGILAAAELKPQTRLYAVHRLDTGTSGIVLFATSRHAAGLVAGCFRARRVAKYYVALTARKPSRKQGSVIGGMARARGGAWRLTRGAAERPAITRFLSRGVPGGPGASAGLPPGLRMFLVKPETGLTHQIRVALKCLGAPVLGDGVYGSAAADRMYLHAAALRLQLPSGGGCFQVVAPPCEGELFCHQDVAALAQQLLPAQLEHELGTWFAGNKLLASRADDEPPPTPVA